MGEAIITTIIPTFRRPRLLERAIRSVASQSFEGIRLLVCDNNSGDETRQVVERLAYRDSRIHYHCHSSNIGATANFNFGLKQVKTPYFSILSDDDVLLKNCYRDALRGFECCPEAACSVMEVLYVDEKGNLVGTSNPTLEVGGHYPPAGLVTILKNGHPPTWTGILFRSTVLGDVGLLDTQVGGAIDYDFEQRVAARFPFFVSKEPGALFVVHPDSWGQNGKLDFVWPGWLKMIDNIGDDLRVPYRARKEVRRLLSRELKRKVFHFGRQAVKAGDDKEALLASGILLSRLGAIIEGLSLWLMASSAKHIPGFRGFLRRGAGWRRRCVGPDLPERASVGAYSELLKC